LSQRAKDRSAIASNLFDDFRIKDVVCIFQQKA